jgi:thymidine kinase
VTAVCRDTGNDAAFTMRLSDEKEQEVIGSTDKYQAVSRGRYLRSMDLGKNEKTKQTKLFSSKEEEQ